MNVKVERCLVEDVNIIMEKGFIFNMETSGEKSLALPR